MNMCKLFEHILPAPHCELCGGKGGGTGFGSGGLICRACFDDLLVPEPVCSRCAMPVSTGGICGACVKQPPWHESCRALFRYRMPVDGLLLAMKFQHRLALARELGRLMALSLACEREAGTESYSCVIPVPLHAARLRERGYNQSLELARPIADVSGLTLDHRCVKRLRRTATQSVLPASQRQRNVRGAFVTLRRFDEERVLLVDDVMTTGNTVNELARVLKKAGAARVEVSVAARAVFAS